MIVISGVTSLICALVLFIARAGGSFLSARTLGGVLGASVGLFAISWGAAGTLYLITLLKMSRDQLTFSALVAQSSSHI
jgi:hypothetical protein